MIVTFSSEGDWVLDLFSVLGIIYDHENIFQSLSYFIYNCLQYILSLFIDIWWLVTTLACSLQKGRNCISIENDKLQCEFIRQWVNAIQTLPDEIQEVGLKKEYFSESLVAKMSKEPQPPLKVLVGLDHFGQLVYI